MAVANVLLGLPGGFNLLRFRHSLRDPRRSSAKTLRAILSGAEHTVFGREHGFSKILEAKDDETLFKRYRDAVPARQYEDFRPYVERMKNGESDVLFPGKPVMYAKTSGSTAEPKWIPISQKYIGDVYGRMTKTWLYTILKRRRDIPGGRILAVVDKLVEGYAPDGTAAGSVSAVLRAKAPGFVRDLYSNPLSVYSISDYEARYYTLMRFAIEQDIRFIAMANPSTVVELLKNAAHHYDDFIRDIETGTLSASVNIEPDIRHELEALLKPNPGRAAHLRRLKEMYGEPLPKHYWPDLRVLNTWKCGNTRIYIDKFEDAFPEDMCYPELGYISSECRFGVVMDDSLQTVPAPGFHYLEFVAEEELGSDDPHFCNVDELELGHRYCPYITTNSGLYRYCMNDIVAVGHKYLSTPTVRMIQKTNGLVSMTGEKLSEWQFVDSVHEAERDFGYSLRFFIGFADLAISGYRFYYEFEKEVSPEELEQFNSCVDGKLMEKNQEYRSKRESLRLEKPVAHILVRDSFEKYKKSCMADGARDGQFKLNLLHQDETRHSQFKKLVKE